jgi:hypothetical protein
VSTDADESVGPPVYPSAEQPEALAVDLLERAHAVRGDDDDMTSDARATARIVRTDDTPSFTAYEVVGHDEDRPVETAISGPTRVGTHSKCGFGALRVKPATPDETTVKNG